MFGLTLKKARRGIFCNLLPLRNLGVDRKYDCKIVKKKQKMWHMAVATYFFFGERLGVNRGRGGWWFRGVLSFSISALLFKRNKSLISSYLKITTTIFETVKIVRDIQAKFLL